MRYLKQHLISITFIFLNIFNKQTLQKMSDHHKHVRGKKNRQSQQCCDLLIFKKKTCQFGPKAAVSLFFRTQAISIDEQSNRKNEKTSFLKIQFNFCSIFVFLCDIFFSVRICKKITERLLFCVANMSRVEIVSGTVIYKFLRPAIKQRENLFKATICRVTVFG